MRLIEWLVSYSAGGPAAAIDNCPCGKVEEVAGRCRRPLSVVVLSHGGESFIIDRIEEGADTKEAVGLAYRRQRPPGPSPTLMMLFVSLLFALVPPIFLFPFSLLYTNHNSLVGTSFW